MRHKIYFSVLTLCLLLAANAGFAQKTTPVSQTSQTKTITIVSEPNATVWVNDIRYGTTDERGRLVFKMVSSGTAKKLRIRANGFKEFTQNILPAQSEIKAALTKTTDEAELAFQRAGVLATSVDREKAIEMYKKAISLRPRYPEAYLEMARVLADAGNFDDALDAVKQAKKLRPLYPEASAVEGRILKSNGDDDQAIVAFKRSIAEGKGFQPEAHTGLGLFYREKAEGFAASGDFDNEKENYLLAAAELKKAIAQLAGAPDAITIYQLLGDSYERAKMYKEAIGVYEEFLRIFPDANEATAVRSFITQIRKQMSEQ